MRTSTRLPGALVPAKLTVVLRRVRPRSTEGSVRLGPFDEHLFDAADPLQRSALRNRDCWTTSTSRSIRSFLTSSGTWSGHRRRFGSLPRRVDERERAVVGDLLDDLERLLEVLLGLAREADDDVGRQREVRDRGAELVHEPQVALAAVGAPHRLEDAGRARLQRQVRVLADRVALRHRGDHVAAEVLRMRAREADALDALDGVDGAQELGEVGPEIAAVGIDVLPEQRDLADALACQPRDLAQDLTGAPADLAAAHRRHDAVRADRVAAHRDLHPGLEPALAVHRQRAGELALVSDSKSAARRLAPGAEPVREMRDRPRPEGDVDERVEVEEPLPLCLCVAAADGDHLLGVGELEHLRVAEVRGEALVRLLADRAGVEDEHVRLLLGDGLPQSELLEHALDPLGVVGVHLAPERGDVVPLHARQPSELFRELGRP